MKLESRWPQISLMALVLRIGLLCSTTLAGDPPLADSGPVRGQTLRTSKKESRQPHLVIFHKAQPAPELEAVFARTEGWIGGDGAQSVSLSPDRTVWLFSDTWVGEVREGKRRNATIVYNTAAVQEGHGRDATIRYFIRRDANGKAEALITPADGRGWYWLQAGVYLKPRLYLFLGQIEKTGKPGVFGFRQVGQWLGIVDNPLDVPTAWRIEQRKLPNCFFTANREMCFGASILQQDGQVYIYGTDEDIKPLWRDRYLVIARTRPEALADFTSWEYFTGSGWAADHRAAGRLVERMASDYSVTRIPNRKEFVLVYTEGGMSSRILARSGPKPWGPWSDATEIYRCPETSWDKRIFCYAARGHATLSSGKELVVSYFANSHDFWHVAVDARLYWPRFVRVPFAIK